MNLGLLCRLYKGGGVHTPFLCGRVMSAAVGHVGVLQQNLMRDPAGSGGAAGFQATRHIRGPPTVVGSLPTATPALGLSLTSTIGYLSETPTGNGACGVALPPGVRTGVRVTTSRLWRSDRGVSVQRRTSDGPATAVAFSTQNCGTAHLHQLLPRGVVPIA